MSQNQALRPFDLLIALDKKSRESSGGMPVYEQAGSSWTGVLVTLGKSKFLVSMRVVREIIIPPAVTNVPGVMSWLKGVANLRGTLFPVMDLESLFNLKTAEDAQQQRLLVLEQQGFMLGILVSAVHGMKNYMNSDIAESLPEVSQELQHLVEKSYQNVDEHYAVLNIELLMQDEEVQNVGMRKAV